MTGGRGKSSDPAGGDDTEKRDTNDNNTDPPVGFTEAIPKKKRYSRDFGLQTEQTLHVNATDYRQSPRGRSVRHSVRPRPEDYEFPGENDMDYDPRAPAPIRATTLLNMMHKWHVQFSGALDEDVENFIMRFDEGLSIVTVRDEDLIKAIPFSVRGAALIWYRGRVHSFRRWSDVKQAMRSRFADPDYQMSLREEISNRTQAHEEPISQYIACMNGLFSRTNPPWPEVERIRYTHRNMLPSLQLVISVHDCCSMGELESRAIRQERIIQRASNYRPLPLPRNSMCPSFAYQTQPRHLQQRNSIGDRAPESRDRDRRRHRIVQLRAAQDDEVEDEEDDYSEDEVLAEHLDALQLTRHGRQANKHQRFSERTKRPVKENDTRATKDLLEPLASSIVIDPEKSKTEIPAPVFATTADEFRSWIAGYPLKALIDSGASKSFLGPEGIALVTQLRLSPETVSTRRVILANGDIQQVNQMTTVELQIGNQTATAKLYLMPSLSQPCVLGLDFLKKMEMMIDFQPDSKFQFTAETTPSCAIICCGIQSLSPAERDTLQTFVDKNIRPPGKLGVTKFAEHDIDFGDNPPVKQKPYNVTPILLEAIWKEVDKMLDDDIIQVSHITVKDAYPIPNMTSILDQLRRARYITTLDLSQAYFQIPLTERARPKTAFVVPGRGLFQFKRMPFGLTNAPATFQRMIDQLIGPEMHPYVFVYLDDIIIVTETYEEHLIWLQKVLEKLQQAGLTINREKSEFCCSEVHDLGFIVNSEGLQIDLEKTSAVREFPAPRNIKQLRKFLRMASWYRRFIPEFATIASSLTKLLKKNQLWEWDTEQDMAMITLKEHLTSALVLACPDFKLPFTLQTDASLVGLGAALTQVIDGQERVIAYASRSLTDAECKYTVTKQECHAVIWSIRKFRCYLEGYEFTVVTDYSSLRWLHNLKNPTGRLARWAIELMQYRFTIIHRKSALHHVPDPLSRIPEDQKEALAVIADDVDRWYNRRIRDVQRRPAELEDRNAWKLAVRRAFHQQVITECHATPGAGHLEVDKTYRRLAVNYCWPNMFQDVVKFVRGCETCQRTKVEQAPPAGFVGKKKVEAPWSVIATDIMGPLPKSIKGHAYLLVIPDLYTKWIELRPLRRATGIAISEAPVLLTDNGTEFVNRDIRSLAERVGFRHMTTPPYHPQADPVERVNRVLKTMITAFIDENHRKWDKYLPQFRFAHNTAHHSSIQTSPAFLNTGRELSATGSLRQEVEGESEFIHGLLQEWQARMRQLNNLRKSIVYALDTAFQ
ncbi:uncharacterized protein LOC128667533 [Microplitis demolitor]|uniref:uncharacterized protein LOC128667533 n=1 Tax=Microplitis demolitor TaxID=69319 RepID=UPI00235B708B|nr:uncharacterized protein LOC128667533 [Microplitis demolitor]